MFVVDANVLIQASCDNPKALEFLTSNAGLMRFGRASLYEFLRSESRASLTALVQEYSVVFDDALDYSNVMAEARRLREALRFTDAGSVDVRVLSVMDSRQLAICRLSEIEIVTNDLQLYKRARDLDVCMKFLDSFPATSGPSRPARRAANYIPKSVVIE